MGRMRTGHYVGDRADPKNRVESDGLTAHQKDFIREEVRLRGEEARLKSEGAWTKRYYKGRWWTRDEWRAAQTESPAPKIVEFKPAFYPHLGAGGRFIEDRAQLRSELKARGFRETYGND